MKTETFSIEGMSCNHCVRSIEDALRNLNLASFRVEIGKAVAEYDENKLTKEQIIFAIDEAGYSVTESKEVNQ